MLDVHVEAKCGTRCAGAVPSRGTAFGAGVRASRRGIGESYAWCVLEEEPAPTRPIDKFARTTAGLVISASMLGLRDVLEGPRDDEPAIVARMGG